MENMAEVVIDTNNQRKRRLPTWMQSNGTSKSEKIGNIEEIFSTSGKRRVALDAVSGIESKSSDTDVVLVEKKEETKNKKIYSKKNCRKSKGRVGSEGSTKFVRSKRKFEEDIIRKTEDEAELSVEDLISIAEEFLSADKVMLHEQSVTRESNSSKSNSIPTSSSSAIEGNLDGGIRSFQSLSKCNHTSNSRLDLLEYKQTDESTNFSSDEVIQSGDAAQDMLELFLGPLLRNAPSRK